MSKSLLVVGDIVLPDRILKDGGLLVEGQHIAEVLSAPSHDSGVPVLDCTGMYVVAGIVDSHVHCKSTPLEGFRRATRGAAVGGITTIIDMPFDSPVPVRTLSRLREKAEELAAESVVDVGLYGTIAKTGDLSEVDALVEHGVCGFKLSMHEADPDRLPRIGLPQLHAAFARLASSDLPIIIHAENAELLHSLREEHASLGFAAHGLSRPAFAETVAIAEALELALWTRARVHIAHVTHPHGFELISAYREMGARVTGELCVHYLLLTDENDVARLGPRAKVNPPLRDATAAAGLWEQLRYGRVATVSSDHAPWPAEAKNRPMLEATAGVPGVETLVPVLVTEALSRGFDLTEILSFITSKPARLFGLDHRKGSLEAGKDADFCVLALGTTSTIDGAQFQSVANWSPFDGRGVAVRVRHTFVRGREVSRDGKIVGEPGWGEWVRSGASTTRSNG